MATKTVYQTDFNGVYVGPVEADESPLEPGVFLIPARCVQTAPPAPGAHQWPAWSNGAWGTVPDWRGTVGYSLSTGEAVTVTELGKTLAELGLSATPIPDPRLPLVAGAARTTRQAVQKQEQAQRLADKGKALEALKLLNGL